MTNEHSHATPKPGPNRLQGLLWAAFATAGVLGALIVPAHILVLGVLGPLGVPAFDRHFSTFASGMSNPLVKIWFLIVAMVIFYMVGHRLRYVTHELGVHGKLVVGVAYYGLAAVGIVFAGWVLFTTP
jgi:fumarate reductase subunit D